MLFIPSSPPVAPLAVADDRATARSGSQNLDAPGSFGEAMARSREAGQEKIAEPALKTPLAKPLRRSAETEKNPALDAASPLAALPVLLESKLSAAALPSGKADTTVHPSEALTTLPETGQANPALKAHPLLPVRLTAETEKVPAPDATTPLAALPVPLEGKLAVAVLHPNRTPAAENLAAPANEALGNPLAAAFAAQAVPSSASSASSASSVLADSGLQAVLSFVARPAGVKNADDAAVQAKGAAPDDTVVSAADLHALNRQTNAASASLLDPSAGQREPSADMSSVMEGEAAKVSSVADAGPWALPASIALQQTGGMQAPNASAPVASALLVPDVGSSEWSKALGQQVLHLGTTGQQVAELQLNPPGLGPLKVMLSLNDQQLQAAFVSAHSSVRTAVEAALPQLRVLLAESGISLGQTSVGAESQPQTAFANGQGDFGGKPPRAGYRGKDADTAALFTAQPLVVQRRPGQGLRIDTWA